LEFEVNGYSFRFAQEEIVKISWEHIRALLIANSELLMRIVEHAKVVELPEFREENIVIITDK
jgi:hypothetical protein